jgi:hypothetical protein
MPPHKYYLNPHYFPFLYFYVRLNKTQKTMAQEKITAGRLATELCEALNSNLRKNAITATRQFAKDRNMICTPTITEKTGRISVTKILDVWLDNHHFWLDLHGEGDKREWKLYGST